MFNLHPAFSSLPTALILLLLIFELINIKYPNKINQFTIEFTSFFCLLAVLLAFFSGYQGVDFVSERCMVPEEFISTHHNFGKTLMFLFIALVVLGFFARRSKYSKNLFLNSYRVLLIFAISLSIYTSFLGGKLVFEHAAGVSADKCR